MRLCEQSYTRRGGHEETSTGQYPWILVDELTINDAAGAPATLTGLLVVVALAVVLVLPALAYLLWLTQTQGWSRT